MNSLVRARQVAVRANQLTGQMGRRMQSNQSEPNPPTTPDFKALVAQARHVQFVKQFGFPSFVSQKFCDFFLNVRMKMIDPKFDVELFKNECKEAAIIFCNLAGNSKENDGQDCKELMTEKAHLQLVNFLEQATPDALEKLNFNEFDIQHFNLIFMNDFKRENRHFVEATFSILMKPKVFDRDVRLSAVNLDLVILRFLRDYTNGPESNTDWIISYFSCEFPKVGDFPDFTKLFK